MVSSAPQPTKYIFHSYPLAINTKVNQGRMWGVLDPFLYSEGLRYIYFSVIPILEIVSHLAHFL